MQKQKEKKNHKNLRKKEEYRTDFEMEEEKNENAIQMAFPTHKFLLYFDVKITLHQRRRIRKRHIRRGYTLG